MENEQLQQLLKFFLDTLAQGKDFALEQAPQFVRELLAWRVAEDIFWIVIFALFIGSAIAFTGHWAKQGLKAKDLSRGEESDLRVLYWLPKVIGAVIFLIVLAVSGYDLVKVKVAPRVVIVEIVTGMLPKR
jgi:hypothetical protein